MRNRRSDPFEELAVLLGRAFVFIVGEKREVFAHDTHHLDVMRPNRRDLIPALNK